jgi:hypothetical protein
VGGGTSLGIGDPIPTKVVAVPGIVVPVREVVPVWEVVAVCDVVVVCERVVVLVVGTVVVVTGVPGLLAQFGLTILSVSRVTAPLRANTRPRIVTWLVTVMLV